MRRNCAEASSRVREHIPVCRRRDRGSVYDQVRHAVGVVAMGGGDGGDNSVTTPPTSTNIADNDPRSRRPAPSHFGSVRPPI